MLREILIYYKMLLFLIVRTIHVQNTLIQRAIIPNFLGQQKNKDIDEDTNDYYYRCR